MTTLAELNQEIKAKNDLLAGIFAKGMDKLTEDDVKEIQAKNAELTDLGKKRDQQITLEQIAADTKAREEQQLKAGRLGPGAPAGEQKQREYKSLGTLLNESPELAQFKAGNLKQAQVFIPDETLARDFGMKTLLTSADWDIPAQRLDMLVPTVQLPITVSDLMLQGTATAPTISYMEETTFTNNAAETAEGGTKPESALDFTLRTDAVRKIPTWIPATDEMLEDVPMMESYIRQRLAFMVTQRRESQLINGNGVAPNLLGILARTGVQTQAKGTDPTPDAVYRAMQKIRVGADSEPTAALFHPNDWTDIRLLRTADGVYIWGSPADTGVERIWGLNIRQTTAMTENTALVGAFRPHAQFFRRSGITITISTEHSTYFVENKVAILAEERVALAVYRPSAFCTVTGI